MMQIYTIVVLRLEVLPGAQKLRYLHLVELYVLLVDAAKPCRK